MSHITIAYVHSDHEGATAVVQIPIPDGVYFPKALRKTIDEAVDRLLSNIAGDLIAVRSGRQTDGPERG